MPPRAKKEVSESAEPPRRSSRIKSIPAEEPVVKAKAAPKKKRTDDDDEGAKATKKKAKTEEKNEAAEDEPADEPNHLDIGDNLPALTIQNEKGEDVQVDTLAAEKGVVLFLVPKADTPGCTTQACGFRDIYPDFSQVEYDVYCLSADSPTAQTKWQTKKTLPYSLLSDPKRELISALGAGAGGKTKRSHFIFEKGGKLIDKKIPVKPADSPKLALEFIKSLSAST